MKANSVRMLLDKSVDVFLISGDRVRGELFEITDATFKLRKANFFRESVYFGPPVPYDSYIGETKDIKSVAALPETDE